MPDNLPEKTTSHKDRNLLLGISFLIAASAAGVVAFTNLRPENLGGTVMSAALAGLLLRAGVHFVKES